jgi:hypothetical protein
MQPTHQLLHLLCPANNLFRAYALTHPATLSHRDSMLYSFHPHEQERDDMIYGPTCSHLGKLRRGQPPALIDQSPKEVIRELSNFPRISPPQRATDIPQRLGRASLESQSADLFAGKDKKSWEPRLSEAGRRVPSLNA